MRILSILFDLEKATPVLSNNKNMICRFHSWKRYSAVLLDVSHRYRIVFPENSELM